MKYAEVEGWVESGEYVSATVIARQNETDESLINRALSEEGTIEVGSTKIYWA